MTNAQTNNFKDNGTLRIDRQNPHLSFNQDNIDKLLRDRRRDRNGRGGNGRGGNPRPRPFPSPTPSIKPSPVPTPIPSPEPSPDDEPVISSSKPIGLYALDSRSGRYRDGNIRNYDFVSGYAWRYSWAELEASEGVYLFEALDHIIDELGRRNQKLSWLIMDGFPNYLLADPEIATWLDKGETKPLPWDRKLLEHYHRFLTAVANHQVPDPARGGQMTPLGQHSVVEIIHPSFPGLPRGSLRNGATPISSIPGYSRHNLFNNAIEPTMDVITNAFPKKPIFLSLWKINDGISSTPLWEEARNRMLNYDNVGFWQDNLAANKSEPNCNSCSATGLPITSYAEPLVGLPNSSFSGFQMLTSWLQPINVDHIDNVQGGVPMDGIQWGVEAYGAKYFEVYVNDLDNLSWQNQLRNWAESLKEID